MKAIDFKSLLRKEKAAARATRSIRPPPNDNVPADEVNSMQTKEDDKTDTKYSQDLMIEIPGPSFFQRWSEDMHVLSNSPIDQISYIPNFVPKGSKLYKSLLDHTVHAIRKNYTSLKYSKRGVAMYDNFSPDGIPMPSWLDDFAMVLQTNGFFDNKPNHVLVNVYEMGQGIMPHTDGPDYKAKTVTLSIGGSVLMMFTRRLASIDIGITPIKEACQVLLEGGSLLVFEQDAYVNHLHSINEVQSEIVLDSCINGHQGEIIDRSFRISFTFRIRVSQGK